MKSNTASDATTLLTWQPFSPPDAAGCEQPRNQHPGIFSRMTDPLPSTGTFPPCYHQLHVNPTNLFIYLFIIYLLKHTHYVQSDRGYSRTARHKRALIATQIILMWIYGYRVTDRVRLGQGFSSRGTLKEVEGRM